jgi:DNA-binding transcriptional LysR family regulator
VAVAETGGVTRAAHKLHLTQSAVSMQIKRLETALGQSLLERLGRGVSLTREGEQLLGYGRRILILNDEAWNRLTHADFEGQVTFGVPPDIIYPHVPVILRAFANDFPRVNVRLVTSVTVDLKQAFAEGEIDLILTTEQSSLPGAELLREEPVLWYGAAKGKAWRNRPLPIAYEPRCLFRSIAIAALDHAAIPWDAHFGASDWRDYSAFVSADLAVVGILKGTQHNEWALVPDEAQLPSLPKFGIYMYLTETATHDLAAQLAGFVRDEYYRCQLRHHTERLMA